MLEQAAVKKTKLRGAATGSRARSLEDRKQQNKDQTTGQISASLIVDAVKRKIIAIL